MVSFVLVWCRRRDESFLKLVRMATKKNKKFSEVINTEVMSTKKILPSGVMFNAYPDSIGRNFSDTICVLRKPEFKDAFSLFYILPTIFHSDLDRGFSIINYDINKELVDPLDLDKLNDLGIQIKFDLVLNHLSVRSPQFVDLLQNGNDSPYKDFFIDWDEFWKGHGTMGEEGHIVPDKEYLDKLFM